MTLDTPKLSLGGPQTQFAKVVVFVKDNEDVVNALQFTRANNLPIAVRRGGHGVVGASSIENGLVIDPSRYKNAVTVDPSKKLAYVGGGAIWETVDKAAIKHGLATVAGTVNHTGVGGLVPRRWSWTASGSYGLAIDNLVQTTSSTDDNLLWYSHIRDIGNGSSTQLNKWWDDTIGKEGVIEGSSVGPDGKPIFIVIRFFNGSEAEGRENFKELLALGPLVDMTREMPYEELNFITNKMAEHENVVYQKGVAHKRPDYKAIEEAHNKLVDAVKTGHFTGGILSSGKNQFGTRS